MSDRDETKRQREAERDGDREAEPDIESSNKEAEQDSETDREKEEMYSSKRNRSSLSLPSHVLPMAMEINRFSPTSFVSPFSCS